MASPFHRYVGTSGDGGCIYSQRRDRQPEFDTIQLHGGQTPDSATNARAVPIYASTSFVFNDSAVSVFAFSEALGLTMASEARRGSLWIKVNTDALSARNTSNTLSNVGLLATSTPASETPQSYVSEA